MLIDSHCHLNDERLINNISDIVQRARDHGVKYMQTICTNLDEIDEIIEIAEKFDELFCSVGVHPNEVAKYELASVEKLVKIAQHPKIIGIGETGLDFYYEDSDRLLQEKSFRIHIEASRRTNLPLIIHNRDSDDMMVSILQEEMQKGAFKPLIHCFTATERFAESVLELGAYISIAGIVTFKNAKDLQSIVKNLPLNRLLVETDSPYLAPTPMRGKTNEPGFVKYVCEFIADLKEMPYSELEKITGDNFSKLFDKAKIYNNI